MRSAGVCQPASLAGSASTEQHVLHVLMSYVYVSISADAGDTALHCSHSQTTNREAAGKADRVLDVDGEWYLMARATSKAVEPQHDPAVGEHANHQMVAYQTSPAVIGMNRMFMLQ